MHVVALCCHLSGCQSTLMPRWAYRSIWCSDERVLHCLPPYCELLSAQDVRESVSADVHLLDQIASSISAGTDRGARLRKLLAYAGRNSSRFRGRLIRAYGPPQEGFYVRGVQALALSMWAEYVGASVFFARGWASDRYYSPQLGESAWEQHFEPPFGVTTGQVRVGRGCTLELSCSALKWLAFDWGGRQALSGPGRGIYPTQLGDTGATTHRLLCAAAASAFVRPRLPIRREASALWQDMTLGGHNSTGRPVVLGVHLRGTDKKASIGGRIVRRTPPTIGVAWSSPPQPTPPGLSTPGAGAARRVLSVDRRLLRQARAESRPRPPLPRHRRPGLRTLHPMGPWMTPVIIVETSAMSRHRRH